MLDTGHDRFRAYGSGTFSPALQAPHSRGGHEAAQEGVLAGALDDASPAGVSSDVRRWGERPVDAACRCLRACRPRSALYCVCGEQRKKTRFVRMMSNEKTNGGLLGIDAFSTRRMNIILKLFS